MTSSIRAECVRLNCSNLPRSPFVHLAQRRRAFQLARAVKSSSTHSPSSINFRSLAPLSVVSFVLISLDVFNPTSLHVLPQIDNLVHGWVVSHTTDDFRSGFANEILSNSFIFPGMALWIMSSSLLAVSPVSRKINILTLGLSWLLFIAMASGVDGREPYFVRFAKIAFHRTRPSALLHSFSFPSGHATADVFIIGVLLFVLVPAIERGLQEQEIPNEGLTKFQEWSPLIWLLSFVATASGRVLADVHWVSDVMAGACFGAAATSGLVLLLHGVQKWEQDSPEQRPRS